MTGSSSFEQSNGPAVKGQLVIGDAGVDDAAVDVKVGVRQDLDGCTVLISVGAGVMWHLRLSEAAGAYVAGQIAAASGVKLG